MKRRIAFVVYALGSASALSWVVYGLNGLTQGPGGSGWSVESWTRMGLATLMALAAWWVTAGIGIRLGVFPVDFFKAIARSLGLGYEVPVEGATRRPRRDEPPPA